MATTTYGSPYVSGSDLVAGWPAASLTVADAIDAAGYYVGRGINTQTASYTGVLTDAGKTVTMSNAGATTVTIPPNSSVAYPTGTRINILNLGAGACTPTAGAGVTISGTISALATNQGAAVVKTATNTWSYLPFSSGTPVLTSSDVSSTTGSPTITTSGANTIYSFTGSGTITLGKAGLASVLVVGGGGGGGTSGTYSGGGGGGGGHLHVSDTYLAVGSITVTVGAGGASFANGNFSRCETLYATWGGFGGTSGGNGGVGASGGGSGGAASTISGGGSISGQGNNGGNNAVSAGFGGGGGGAGGAGGNSGGATNGGIGGVGTSTAISGTATSRAGGGGGGGSPVAGTATSGGGAGATSGAGTAGTVNTGGGGGGGNGASAAGGAGGSGVVIISVVT